jgi:hypothetical protein
VPSATGAPELWVSLNLFGAGQLPVVGEPGPGPNKPTLAGYVKRSGGIVNKEGPVVFQYREDFVDMLFDFLFKPRDTKTFVTQIGLLQRDLLAGPRPPFPPSLGFLEDPAFFTEKIAPNSCVQKSFMADLKLAVGEFVHRVYGVHPNRSVIGKHIFRLLKFSIAIDLKTEVDPLLDRAGHSELKGKVDKKLTRLREGILAFPRHLLRDLPPDFREITEGVIGEDEDKRTAQVAEAARRQMIEAAALEYDNHKSSCFCTSM